MKRREMTISEIEVVLREDIAWTIEFGPGWNPAIGAKANGEWHQAHSQSCCEGVCAIGAFCIHRQPRKVNTTDHEVFADVIAASRYFGRSYQWTIGLYQAVNDDFDFDDSPDLSAGEKLQIKYLAKRLSKFAEDVEPILLERRYINEALVAEEYHDKHPVKAVETVTKGATP